MSISITRIVIGPLENNSYIVRGDSPSCLIIDPASGCGELIDKVRDGGLDPAAIVLTHGHFDHILGIPEVLNAFPGLAVYISEADSQFLRDPELNGSVMMGREFVFEGSSVKLTEGAMEIGGIPFEVVAVPGHTPGGCALIFGDNCFSGDILFAGSIGRSDFPGGDGDALIQGIRERLMVLPETMVVWPGHGGRTTIGREKRMNPFLT